MYNNFILEKKYVSCQQWQWSGWSKLGRFFAKNQFKENIVQCNLDLVTLLVSVKTVTKSHNVTKSNDFN